MRCTWPRAVSGWELRWRLLGFIAAALLLLLPLTTSAYISTGPGGDTSWYWENPLPQGNSLTSQSFVDDLNGWAVGKNGVVLKTTDGGTTWTHLDPRVLPSQYEQSDIEGVAFSDLSRGLIVGESGLVKRTDDGGSTWVTQTVPATVSLLTLNAVSSVDASTAIAVGQNNRIIYTTDGGATWKLPTANPLPAAGSLLGVSWATTQTAYAVGDSGVIVRTNDAGVTWAVQTSGTTNSLQDVSFAPGAPLVGYAVGLNGTASTILRTTNGGTSWALLPNVANIPFYAVDMLNSSTCVIAGADGAVYVTTTADAGTVAWSNRTISQLAGPGVSLRSACLADATHIFVAGDYGASFSSPDFGLSWSTQSAATSANFMATWFVDANRGWVAGATGMIERTVNGGASWTGTRVGAGTWRGMCFTNASYGFVVGDGGAIYSTVDGGVTWTPQNSTITPQLNSVYFVASATTPTVGIAVGNTGTILRTSNGGATWTKVTSGTTQNLNGAYMTSSSVGWAVGNRGAILHTADGGLTWTPQKAAKPGNRGLNAVRGIPGTANVWIAGDGGLLWSTTNGGTKWNNDSNSTGTTSNLYSVYYQTTSLGWIAGANGTVRYQIGGGAFAPASTTGLPAGTTIAVHSIVFADVNTGYLAADAGTLRKSTDGGRNWSSQQSALYARLNSVTFADLMNGWICGSKGLVLSSTDGGDTWSQQSSGSTLDLNGTSFSDTRNGFTVGAGGVIRRTTDGGASWVGQSSGTTQQLNGVAATAGDASRAMVVGNSGTVLRTLNGGATWAALTVPAAGNVMAVSFPSSATPDVAVAVCDHAAGSGAPSIIRTTDFGTSWSVVNASAQPLYAIDFAPSPDGNVGWAAGAAGTVLNTTDAGTTWVEQASNAPGNSPLSAVSAVTTQSAFVAGANGVVVQTSDGGASWLAQNSGWGSAGSEAYVRSLAFVGANHGFAVGDFGAILRTSSQVPPVTTLIANPSAPDGGGGWYMTAPSITLLPDQQAQTYHSRASASGPFVSYTAPLTAAEGTSTIYFYSVNAANRQETVKNASFKVDTTDPTAAGLVTAAPVNSSTIAVSYSQPATDNASGVAYYEVWYQLANSASPSLATTISALTSTAYVNGLTPNTSYDVWLVAYDVAGNFSVNSSVVTAKTLAYPALTTAANVVPSPPTGANGFYVTTPTVSFAVSPAVAAWTYCAWDSSTLATYTAPVPALAGVHTLSYYSVDQARLRGQENTNTLTINLDTTPPGLPATFTASASTTSSIDLTWTPASDPESGIDSYALYREGSLVATFSATTTSTTVTGLAVNTAYGFTLVTVNRAGHSSTTATVTGRTQPNPGVYTTESVYPPLPDGEMNWYVTTPTVTLESMPSAIPVWTYYWWGASAPATYTPPAELPPMTEGMSALSFYSVDRADPSNREATRTVTFKVDTIDPAAPTSVAGSTASTSSVAVTWTAAFDTSPGSGVDHYVLYVDDLLSGPVEYGAFTSIEATVTGLVPSRLYRFFVATVDVAGNTSYLSNASPLVATSSLGMFTTTASVLPETPDGQAGWYVTTPTVMLTPSPADVPAWTYYAWDSSALATYTAPVPVPDGAHTLSFWSVDQAGEYANEDTKTVDIKVDRTAPSTPTISASSIKTDSIDINWASSVDTESGVGSYRLYVDEVLHSILPSSAITVNVTGLQPNHSYLFRLASTDVAGLSAQSDTLVAATDALAGLYTLTTVDPPAPGGQNGWYDTTPAVTLAADAHSGAAPDNPVTYFWWDSSSPTTCTAPIATPEGVSTLHYYSTASNYTREATQTLTFSVDTVVPSAPLSVEARVTSTSSVAVTWTAAFDTSPGSGVDHYVLYVDDLLSGPVEYGTFTSTEATVTGLVPNRLYRFFVTTVDVAGNTSYLSNASPLVATSSLGMFTTTASVLPETPDGQAGWYVTTPTVMLTPSPADVPAWTYYAWDSSALATYTAPVPVPDGAHTLLFWSVDQAGEYANEDTKTVDIKVDSWPDIRSGVPSSAQSVVASAAVVTDTQVLLAWMPVDEPYSGVDRYEIWEGTTYVGSSYTYSYLVSGLSPQTAYSYQVYAANVAGTTFSASDPVDVTTRVPAASDPPTVVAAQAADGGRVFVNWQPVDTYVGEVGYHVWRSEDGITYEPIATLVGRLSSSYADSGLTSSTRYWYAVSAFDDRGESSLSDTSTAQWPYIAPTTRAPERPAGLASVEGSGSVALSWLPVPNPGVAYYRVLRADRSLGTTTVVSPPILGTSSPVVFEDATVVNNSPYWYSVVAVDASGAVGFPSLELETRPQAGVTEPNPHLLGTDSGCVCHRSHVAAAEPALVFGTQETICYGCHPCGTVGVGDYQDPLARSTHAATGTVLPQGGALTCLTCHVPGYLDERPLAKLLRTDGAKAGTTTIAASGKGGMCYSCHGAGSELPQGDMTVFESSAHSEIATATEGPVIVCDACHESHSSRNEDLKKYSDFMLCVRCHDASTDGRPGIWDQLQASEDTGTKLPLLPEDQAATGGRIACRNCHNTHTVNATYPLVDPHDPSPSGVWTDSRSDLAPYCFQCHDGEPLPTSEETTIWADPVIARGGGTTLANIKAAFSVNVHGFGTPIDTVTAQARLRPDMGYSVGSEALPCETCHEIHGSSNSYALTTSVRSADGNMKAEGLLVYKIPSGGGYDLRFFCNSCHLWTPANHDAIAGTNTATFPVDCTSCHRHVTTGGEPTNRL